MLRYLFLILLLLYLLKGTSQPNVLFILVDDLGYGELGSYGSQNTHTPALDDLISDGVQFYRAYANSTVCSPSRASILFGDYPDLLGVPGVIRDIPLNTWGNLRDDVVSMPANFKKLGYQTALVGKWHLGYESPDLPNDRGFDFFKGFVGDMMDDYYTHLRAGVNWMRQNERVIEPAGHATELFTQWAMDFIDEKAASQQPFFLFLAYNAPHDPVQPPAEYLERVQERLPNVPLKRQKMIGFIEHLDASIREVVNKLKDLGLYEETIIVFTSDNGGALGHGANNFPFNGGKGDMLEGGIRVPCSLIWKSRMESAKIHRPFILMDFYDLLPRLVTGEITNSNGLARFIDSGSDEMIWVRREGHRFGGLAYYAISDGRYKILQNSPFESFRLYDLEKDSIELNPLQMREMEQRLLKSVTEHIQKSGNIPWQ